MTSQGNILATCADDRTVRLYNGFDFELIGGLSTTDIEDWHTITYLSLEDNGEHLICATQNGYVVVWSISSEGALSHNATTTTTTTSTTTPQKTFKGKMHVGSIEGLVWHPKTKVIASCSSDCSINVYKLQ